MLKRPAKEASVTANATERIISIVSPDSAPIKRMIQEVRERGDLIDASFGRSTRSVLIMDSGNVILSALSPDALAARADNHSDEEEALNHG